MPQRLKRLVCLASLNVPLEYERSIRRWLGCRLRRLHRKNQVSVSYEVGHSILAALSLMAFSFAALASAASCSSAFQASRAARASSASPTDRSPDEVALYAGYVTGDTSSNSTL